MPSPGQPSAALSELLDNVDAERDEFRSLGEFDEETKGALSQAFLPERISDTLNIEGIEVNPRITLAIMTGAAVAESDKYARQEIENILAAHQYVEGLIAAGDNQVSPSIVQKLNAFVERNLLDSAGVFRSHDLQISGAQVTPPHWKEVGKRVEEMCAGFAYYIDFHPIVRAAWLHRELAEIHPFADGNGRTARLLQDFVMATLGYLPVGIPAIRRREYYDALQQADYGDLEPLVAMIANSELTALTKARRVVVGGGRRAAVERLMTRRSQEVNRSQHEEYELWRRLAYGLVTEAEDWANQIAQSEPGLVSVKGWDPLDYDTWNEIRDNGFSRNSWVMTITVRSPENRRKFSVLFAAKRIDRIRPLTAMRGSRNIGFQVVVADDSEKFNFDSWNDEYIKLRAVSISSIGYEGFLSDQAGPADRRNMTAFELIESLFGDCFLKAGWYSS